MIRIIVIVLHLCLIMPLWAGSSTIMIERKPYRVLEDFAREQRLKYHWDEERQVLTLTSPQITLKFIPFVDWFWLNGKRLKASRPIRYWRGQYCVTEKAYALIDKEIKAEKRRRLPVIKPLKRVSSSARAVPSEKKSYEIRRIMIDAGHGGKDSGALGQGLKEKNVVLNVAKKLRNILKKRHYDVVMTRTTDVFIPLWKRSEMANQAGVDLFISLHANAAKNKSAQGIEVFYLSDDMDDYARTLAAKENSSAFMEKEHEKRYKFLPNDTQLAIWDITYDEYRRESIKLSDFILKKLVKSTGLKNRGIKGARFFVIKNTLHPSVLVEMGFISNKEDARVLSDQVGLLAASIADGVIQYSREFAQTQGFSE